MYLQSLSLRLAGGALRLPEPLRSGQAAYLRAAQNEDGGFAGREGPSDPYYAGFGLRGLALLGALDERSARPAAEFLAAALDRKMPIIDFLSVLYSAALLEFVAGIDPFALAGRDRRQALLDAVAPHRRDDGAYAKTPQGPHSSTYHTFLVTLARELVGLEHDEPGRTAEAILARQRDDGGFVELGPLNQSGTSPTSAAVGLLRMLDHLDGAPASRAAGFLAGMQTPEGGLRANTKIPVADLLSTFTGLVALADLDGVARIDLAAAGRYAESMGLPSGGFRGGVWDSAADVEYTFYGLGTLALAAGTAR